MSFQSRQVLFTISLGILPAALLLMTLWVYGSLVESMKRNLQEQRALALKNLPVEDGLKAQTNFSWAIWSEPRPDFSQASPDWPQNLDPEALRGFVNSLGSGTEKGIEIEHSASGPAMLWIVSTREGLRAAFQPRRSFLARLETLRILIALAGLLLSGGAFVVFVTMARKLSDLFSDMEAKNLELERANRNLEELGTLKSNFLALVSHELRTPLARISGHLQIVNRDRESLPEPFRHRLEEITVEIDELGRMTKNVLDLTRLQSEDLAARIGLGQIGGIVRAGAERIRSQALLRGMQLTIDTPETPPVHHDPYLLERVLDNLLVNAVKYGQEGGMVIVRTVEEEEQVRLEVESSGKIIPVNDRERIFEKFHRISEDSLIPGTGLGLYLVRQFILMMGGRAWVEPASEGNRFVVTLPLG
jgi:signal transduction histidine kinase